MRGTRLVGLLLAKYTPYQKNPTGTLARSKRK